MPGGLRIGCARRRRTIPDGPGSSDRPRGGVITTLQLALVLVASIWAAVNTLIAGYNAVNATRDRILTGHTDEGVPLSLEHRRLMYRNDWLPLKAGLGLVSLAFAAFLVLLPELSDEPTLLRVICYLAAALPFFSFLGFAVLGVADRRFIVRTLERQKEGPGYRGAPSSSDSTSSP